MEISSSNRRSFNRTWKRLGPLLELIVASTSTTTTTTTLSLSSSNENRKLYSIADVGCDHGILSMSLACMAHVSSSSSSSSSSQRQQQQLADNNDSIIDGTVNNNSNNNNNNNNNNNFFFNRVYGIDLSSKALDDGALQTLKKITNAITWSSSSSIAEYYYINSKSNNNENNNNNNNTELLPIEFRISNGLEALHIGEADAIVLAGMGVETMMEILFLDNDGRRRRSGKETVITPPIDRVQTNHIYLQPANSRPQHMMKLYDRIQQTGEWILGNESIAYSSGRWYINSFFERRRRRQQLQQQNQQFNNDDGDDDVGGDSRFCFPGHFLVQQVTVNDNENVYESYIKHHLQWLKDDCERTPKYVIEDEDRRWIEYITGDKPKMGETNIVGTISQR
jgi:tRNA A22 N-methylase